MANEVNSAAAQSFPPEQSQCDNVAHLAKRIHGAANSAARALQPIIYLRSDQTITRDLVQAIYALSAGLSALIEDLMLESVSRGGSQSKDLWSKKHHESLLTSMEQCHGFLTNTCHHVRIADERHKVKGLAAGEKYIDHLHLDNESQVREEVEKCSGLVSQTGLIVKHTCLRRFENLNDEEVQEALRLTAALQRPDFDNIWVLKYEVFASSCLRAALGQKQAAATSSINLPGNRTLSSTQDLMPSNHRKPTWVSNNLPSMSTSRYPTNVVPATAGPESANNTPVTSPPFASGSTQERSLNDSKSSSAPTESRLNVEPGTVTFGEPSVIKPLPAGGSVTGRNAQTASFSNWKPTSANPFNPTPHLEAYIVRPLVESTDLVTKLSYKVESLRLGETVLQTQVENLDRAYSIMDVLLDLQPQVLNLIQSRAAQRQGNIVSVKYGRPTDVSTAIGSLQIKPTVFIISTTTVLPQDSTPVPVQLPNPAESALRPTTGGGLFDKIRPTPGFGSSANNTSKHHLAPPEAYSTHLEEQGEPCTWVEWSEAQGLQHYQTFTANKKYHGQDRSFEEIRLADYHAGRRTPMKNTTITYPWSAVPASGAVQFHDFSRSAFPSTPEPSKTGLHPRATSASSLGPTVSGAFHNNARQSGGLAPDLQAKQIPSGPWIFKSTPQQTSNEAWTSSVSSQRSLSKKVFDAAVDTPRSEPAETTFLPISPRKPTSDALNTRSEPVTDSQGVCTSNHVHGPFCLVPPSQDSTPPLARGATFFGDNFPASTTVSPFGSLTSDPKNRPFATALYTKDSAAFSSTPSEAANEAPKWSSCSPPTLMLGQTSRDKAPSTTASSSVPSIVQQSAVSGPISDLVPPTSGRSTFGDYGAHNLESQGAGALQAVERQFQNLGVSNKTVMQEVPKCTSSVDEKDPPAFDNIGVHGLLSIEQIPMYDKACGTMAKSLDKKCLTPNNILFIGNLPFDCTTEVIQKVFQGYGSVTRISLPTNSDGGQKGIAYVEFSSIEEATAAVKAPRAIEIDSRRLRVDFADRRDHFGPYRTGAPEI